MLKKVRHLLTLQTVSDHTGIPLATLRAYSKWERTPSHENATKLKVYFLKVAEQIKAIAKGEKKPKVNQDEFEEFWKQYPRKIGRKAAKSKYRTARKDATHEQIMEGLERYNTHLRKDRIEAQYIAHPMTWLNQWRRDDEYKGVSTVVVNQQIEVKPKEEKPPMTEEERQRAKERMEATRQQLLHNTAM